MDFVSRIRNWAPLPLMVAALVAAGLLTYKDYGNGWDEPVQRQLGQLT